VATTPMPASSPPDPPAAESEPTGSLRSNRAAIATGASTSAICVRAVKSPGASFAVRMFEGGAAVVRVEQPHLVPRNWDRW